MQVASSADQDQAEDGDEVTGRCVADRSSAWPLTAGLGLPSAGRLWHGRAALLGSRRERSGVERRSWRDWRLLWPGQRRPRADRASSRVERLRRASVPAGAERGPSSHGVRAERARACSAPPPAEHADLLAVGVAGAALAADARRARRRSPCRPCRPADRCRRPRDRCSGIWVLLQGMTTWLKQDDRARDSSRNGIDPGESWARSGTVGRRSATRPRSSPFETSRRSWPIHGFASSSALLAALRARERLARERAQRREVLVDLDQRRPADRRAPAAARRSPGLERAALGCEGAADDAEVGDQVLELALVLVQRATKVSRLRTKPARSPGWRPSSASLTWAVEPIGGRRGPERLLEALGAAVLVERVAELLQEDLEVGRAPAPAARSAPGRTGPRSRSGHRDHRAAVELGRLGRARVQVDEEVALEEEARPQLHRRVLLDRQGARPSAPSSPPRRPGPCRRSTRCSTSVTLPTLTPAIRTGLLTRMFWASGRRP